MIYSLKYTDDLPAGFNGWAWLWHIKIRPAYSDDIGLLEHEKVHVKQFWRLGTLHAYLYWLSKRYRLKCEVEAYREQLKYGGDIDLFAKFISEKYDLKITIEDARRKLGD